MLKICSLESMGGAGNPNIMPYMKFFMHYCIQARKKHVMHFAGRSSFHLCESWKQTDVNISSY